MGVVIGDMVVCDVGYIVIIGLLSGFCGLFGVIGYGVFKVGFMYLVEGMYVDLKKIGVDV